METTGQRIRKIRKSLGLSMDSFGELFDPPASKGVISNWENNYNLPNNVRLKRIAEIGHVDTDYLLNGTTDLLGNQMPTINLSFFNSTLKGIKRRTIKNSKNIYLYSLFQLKNDSDIKFFIIKSFCIVDQENDIIEIHSQDYSNLDIYNFVPSDENGEKEFFKDFPYKSLTAEQLKQEIASFDYFLFAKSNVQKDFKSIFFKKYINDISEISTRFMFSDNLNCYYLPSNLDRIEYISTK